MTNISNDPRLTTKNITTSSFTIDKTLTISNAYEIPFPVINNMYQVPVGYVIQILGTIDLLGRGLNFLGVGMIVGTSSETSTLTSTGLTASLITSTDRVPIQNITLSCPSGTIFDLNSDGAQGLDIVFVNTGACQSIGTIANYSNVVWFNCAFLDHTDGLTYGGSIGTIAYGNCLWSSSNLSSTKAHIYLPNTLTITRRFRIIYSSMVVLSGRIGVSFDNATIPTDNFILDTVNFSGGSANYLSGIDASSSNLALIENTIGITNSAEIGSIYMNENITATTISNTTDYFNIAGTFSAGENQKFTTGNNLLTYTGAITARFFITVVGSLSSGNNQDVSLILRINGVNDTNAEIDVSTDSGGKFQSFKLQYVKTLAQNATIAVYVRNRTSTTSITVRDLSIIIYRIV